LAVRSLWTGVPDLIWPALVVTTEVGHGSVVCLPALAELGWTLLPPEYVDGGQHKQEMQKNFRGGSQHG